MTESRRLRTEAERDPERWRRTAHTRPGYATYPGTPPGSPSWWHGQPPTPATAAAAGPQPGDHDRCVKWCGFCHLGNGEPAEQPAEPSRIAPECTTSLPQIHAGCDGCDCDCHTPPPFRRRWWHRYTRRNP